MHFIVIEGLDGAGKSTQISFLKDHFAKSSLITNYLHFPRTEGNTIYGDLIARFLRGEFGKLQEVSPWLVALLYAGDRNDASGAITNWLRKKHIVIADRYIYSNIAYQCAKVKSPREKKLLHKWIKELEYNYYKIPKPTASLFLDVPFNFTVSKLTANRDGKERDYLNGRSDIHENDILFQQQVRQEYLNLCKSNDDFVYINCMKNKTEIDSPEVVFKKILKKLNEKLKIF